MPKKTKSRYELREKLGEGGMGVVWRAFDSALNTDVALKLLLDIHDPAALRLFYEECHKQSSLAHPNIVEVRDVGVLEDDGKNKPYLVMPLLRGKTLSALMRASAQPLATDRCVDILSQACRGLQAAHDFGLLHRDIKPSNIFVLEDDSVKIIDFGVAHRLDVSRTVSRKGTLLYMSPEQLSMRPLSRASDVFSLATVGYEVLTRKQPFLAATEEGVSEAIRTLHPPPASSINAQVSVALGQVLCKAMAKDAQHRFSRMKEFAEYLRRAQFDESFTVFDPEKFRPRLEKARDTFEAGNLEEAQELVNELKSEGYLTPELEQLAAATEATSRRQSIARMLASARARMQDGEFRLALQRVHEALQLEPRQQEALVLQHDIEARRAEADTADWLRVGQQHLEKFSFSHARQAAQRILEHRPGEERALSLLERVERRESEVNHIRQSKQEAFAAALEAEKRNELTSALSKMKQVLELERQAPDAKVPGQLATYESLYNRLHSEHEAIEASYAEAKRALDEDRFIEASAVCDKFLDRFPQHTLFKALKFDIEQRWRRSISMRLIEVEERVESETDLEQRVQLLEATVADSPEVPEFARLLEGTRKKRDLVHGIVQRARELESRELYGEALVQWETLRTIFPAFPGLAYQIENVRLRRQLVERMSRKSRWILQITDSLEQADFEQGLRLLSPAVEEFPEDTEFSELRVEIHRQRDLADEAERLIRDGNACLRDEEFARGLGLLRTAYELGSKVKRAKTELIDGLLRAARAHQDDAALARSLLQEILQLDPGNHAATGLLRFLDDQFEYQQIEDLLTQARQLRASNDLNAAVALVQQGCEAHPRSNRLRQVLREMTASRSELRTRELEVVRRRRLEADTLESAPSIHEHLTSVERIAERYADDEEFQSEQRILRARLQTVAATTAEPTQSVSAGPADAHLAPAAPTRRPKRLWWAFAAAALLVAGLVVASLWQRPAGPKLKSVSVLPAASPVALMVTATRGATIRTDGHDVGKADPNLQLRLSPGKHLLQASLGGYADRSETVTVQPDTQGSVDLQLSALAEALEFYGDGTLAVDRQPPVPLASGQLRLSLANGPHLLRWAGKGAGRNAAERLDVRVNVQDGRAALPEGVLTLSGAGAVLLVSTAGGHARLYANTTMPLNVDGQEKGTVTTTGRTLDLAPGTHVLRAGSGPAAVTGSIAMDETSTLLIAVSGALSPGVLSVSTNIDGATVRLLHDSIVVRQGVSAQGNVEFADVPPGAYLLEASAPDADAPEPQRIQLSSGRVARIALAFKKTASTGSLHILTAPGAAVSLDGKNAGVAAADGSLVLTGVTTGEHHLDARNEGRQVTADVAVPAQVGASQNVELPLSAPAGAVTLQLSPADSTVTIYRANGEVVPGTSTHLSLAEGRYHFIARAPGYTDRAQAFDVTAGSAATVDLTLSPITLQQAVPTLAGWNPDEWTLDAKDRTLTHSGTDVAFYSARPDVGKYLFAGNVGRGFLLNRSRVQWVLGYHDPENYLQFSLDRSSLEFTVINAGKKTGGGGRITFPPLSSYRLLLQVEPGKVSASLWDGKAWKLLGHWNAPPGFIENGRFGFKGAATLTAFQYTR